MTWTRSVLAVVAVAALALPITASIKNMNLYEFMEINHDVLHGKVVARDTIESAHPWEGSIYTRLTIEGESVTTGKAVREQVVFMGSHDPKDRFNHSEMPELRDVRIGTEVVVFYAIEKQITEGGNPEGAKLAFNLSSTYRVERGFGEPVVIGKGSFAFPENIKLADAKSRIRVTHQAIEADRAAATQKLGK